MCIYYNLKFKSVKPFEVKEDIVSVMRSNSYFHVYNLFLILYVYCSGSYIFVQENTPLLHNELSNRPTVVSCST